MPALIWLIEDNPAYRDATQLILNTQPDRYATKAFESCEDAIAAVSQGEAPAVILLDVELPGMDGIEGIRHFKKLLPDASLLILTVFENDEKIFRAICAGAAGYLLKSEPLGNVIVAIDQAIAGGAPMNPRIARRVLTMFSDMAPVKKDYGLSPREQDVLEYMVEGLSKKQIADKLDLSAHTITFYVRGIYKKLHVHCQTAAVSVAMRDSLVSNARQKPTG